jgi:hypothetical protein
MTESDSDDLRDAAAPATFVVTDELLARLDPDAFSAIVSGHARFVAVVDDGVHTVPIEPR